MLDNSIVLSTKSLTKDEVLSFFKQVTDVFPRLLDLDIANAYAEKLSDNACFVTACYCGRIIGMIAYYMNIRPLCYLSCVCVQSNWCRYGIFSKMLSLVESIAKNNMYTLIKLEVSVENVVAQQVYMKKGFVLGGRTSKGLYMEKNI